MMKEHSSESRRGHLVEPLLPAWKSRKENRLAFRRLKTGGVLEIYRAGVVGWARSAGVLGPDDLVDLLEFLELSVATKSCCDRPKPYHL